MHEVRVESLEKPESREGRMLLSANAGSLSIVFSQEVWENLLANAPSSAEPTPEELEELDYLNEQLEWHADANGTRTKSPLAARRGTCRVGTQAYGTTSCCVRLDSSL
jgi:hypothetical protein